MNDVYGLLDAAVEHVRTEQQAVRAERDAFREFRDSLPQSITKAAGPTTDGIDPAELSELYRETVMATADYESAHGDRLKESIETEFPPTVAEALLSERTISQRLKRNLLIAVNESLEQRNRFVETLETERTSLQRTREAVVEISEQLWSLPVLSLEGSSFESVSEAWCTSERLLERCERLVDDRQQRITDVNESLVSIDEPHALNCYLYGVLETAYPALHALIEMRSGIERYRSGDLMERGSPLPESVDSNTSSPAHCGSQ